ncbi:filamentous hemagglutinin N-terminal domain-containing protein [Pseudomonas aeruginosa]|uniref:MBG domain-containing protein n=1 Tax=Pseudomonas aeruginosa TaxID=287 RepID=UPI000F86E9FA|nr:MBG domain-containing protein [Pseudomonas aeruginosa]RUH99458.1 filamentous hemagglutinin N-terminal domain-containing protein [Pseudomonas aeruginosa]
MNNRLTPGATQSSFQLRGIFVAVALATASLTIPEMVLANSLPQGGQVIGGQATIIQQGNNMDVNTSSARTAINWQRFNVGPDNRITFNQPDGKSVTLNRVVGNDPSKIYGAVTSNGQLILVNPNGIMVGPKAHISSSALVASAGFLTEEQAKLFAQTGKLDIQLTGNVTNLGHITVHDNGMVALLGAQVNNAGVIQARKGTVQLATGPKTTLDFHGDGLLNIAVNGTPGEKDSVNADVTGGVHHSGEIDVGDGTVAMSAARAAKHLDSVINVTGSVAANSVTNDGGTIVLGNAAQTNVSGNLSAKGVNGGQIKVLGDEVNVAGSAMIDASGTQGSGGKVLVGGSYQGKGSEYAAKSTTVAKGAQLKADGKTAGGQVVVWSDGTTHFAGSASAKGGRKGGVVETSGKQLRVTSDAKVDASGAIKGTWLLDPETVNIVTDSQADAGTGVTSGAASGPNTADLWNVAVSAIVNGLANGNVEVSANNRINVNTAIVATNIGQDGNGNASTLALIASGNPVQGKSYEGTDLSSDSGSVYINAPILLKDGNLFIAATGDIRLNNTGSDYGQRAIIDVGNGIAWLRTSNVASVIQQDGTAVMGKQVALEGASVRMESNLNYAGTLAGKASNGMFRFNQTNATGTTNVGTVTAPFSGESLTGVTAQQLVYRGYQDIVADPSVSWGSNTHPITLKTQDGSSFDYLVFEATGFVTRDGSGGYREIDPAVLLNYLDSSDYLVSGLTFTDNNGITWKIEPDATSANLAKVTRTDASGSSSTSSLPVGFSFDSNGGKTVVSTANTHGWGIESYAYIAGASDQKEIQHNAQDGSSQQLVGALGDKYDTIEALISNLINDTPWLQKADPTGPKLASGEEALERARVHFYETVDKTNEPGVIINSAAPATVTVTADDKAREYGDANPALTQTTTYDGNAQAVKGVDDYVNQQLGRSGIQVNDPTTAATATSDVKAGGYDITNTITSDERSQGRYKLDDNKGTLSVDQAQLRVKADEKAKVYGDTDPALTYQVTGQKLGESAGSLVGGNLDRTAGENVGIYGITQGGVNSLSGNYRISFEGDLLRITPAELAVTAHDQSKVYGDADPTLTYSVNGLKNGDQLGTVLNSGSLSREAGENVRPEGYSIGQGHLALTSGNYTMVFKDGTLQITPAQLVVTADDKSKVQGQVDPALTYQVSGLKNGDSASVAQGTLTRAPGEEVGSYAIGQNDPFHAGTNYTVTFRDGALTITGPLVPTDPITPIDPASPVDPVKPVRPVTPSATSVELPVTAQSPGNTRCDALESPSAVSANYTVSPAVARTYSVQLICKPRSYGNKQSTTPDIRDVLTYANSLFKEGKLIVPDWNRSVIPHDLQAPTKGGK